MSSSSGSSSSFHSSTSDLPDQICCFPVISDDTTVNFFKQEFKFLKTFVRLQSFTDEHLDTHEVQALLQETVVDSSELRQAEFFDFRAFLVQNMFWLTKMEIRSKYSYPKISSVRLDESTVTKFIDIVVDNLHDLVLYVPETKDHIEDALKELKFQRIFVTFVSEGLIEPPNQHHPISFFLAHVLAVASHASMLAWLYFSGRGYKEDHQHVAAPGEINFLLFLKMKLKLVEPSIRKIYISALQVLKCPNTRNKHIRADIVSKFLETIRRHLAQLPTNANVGCQRVALKDHLEILQGMLNFLIANIDRVLIQDIIQDIDAVVIDVGLLVYSLYEEEGKEDTVLKLLGNIECTSTMIYLTIRKAFQSNLPRIHGLGYVDFVLNNLKEFQSRHPESLASVTSQLQTIQNKLESLQPFLESIAAERHNDLNKTQCCATQLIGKAYEVEYLVDACISKKAPVWCLEHWFSDIMEEITLVRDEIAEILEKKMFGDARSTTVVVPILANLARPARMNEEIVGFQDVIEKLRIQLVRGTKGRDVIPIVGMPGLGKTTLAYRLYTDKLVLSHFDIRAHCCVSQVYSRKDLLLAILSDATGENFKCSEDRVDELADQLHRTLYFKRYLILVDDVWETSVWDDLIGCFQDANNGSRIILTTRYHEVAEYARFECDPFPLRMFHDDESWELLRKKVFGEESCPPLLTNTGQEIAKKCGRLPLSVALVAGILADMEKKEECWKQVAENLGPHIHNDSRAIVEHSYQILPYHLRLCFLYFGAFLEDSVINASKLTRLWISEGFIKSFGGKSLEDIAQGYLENLIRRNLVMETKKSSRGKIKACHIHDLLHDFCKERAKEENLHLWIGWDQYANPSSRVYCHKQPAHRISIYGEGNPIGESSSCWSHVGSILLHRDALSFETVSLIFHSFKFLRVLDLEFAFVDSFPTDLVYLRYFAAQTLESSMSSYIANCWNLETLILNNSRINMAMPVALWEMVKLRHLHISNCIFTVEKAEELLENLKKLSDLETLSTPYFSCVEKAELILRKTPNLRELRCQVNGVSNFQYYVLKFPTRIETLKIDRNFTFPTVNIPLCISAPNLKNLTLNNFFLHPKHLSKIALLQNLQLLKLKGIKFDKKGWNVSTGEFLQLKVLKLQRIDHFEEWTVEDGAFPNLERLVLAYCRNLMEVPTSSFGDICSLKSIEVRKCNELVNKSARDIWKTQVEEYQNSIFEVFLH